MCDEITSGYSKRNCRAIAGIKSFIPIDMSNVGTFTVDAAGVVTALTSARTCFRYTLDVNSSSYTQSPTGDRANGAYNIVQAFTAIFKDDENTTDQAMNLFVQGYYGVIVELRNGKRKYLGAENGLTVTTIEMTSGLNGTDLAGSTLNMEGDENTVAPEIADVAIITALLAPHS
jgi:hypothetical protein